MIAITITFPVAYTYTPVGNYIHIMITPASNSTLGGIYAFDCPTGELAHTILENGTVLCATP